MKLNEHLKKMHTTMATHHLAMAKAHKAALAKAQAMESDGDGLSEFHKAAMDAHTQAGEYHAQCAKDLSATGKAAGMGDNLDDLMPSPISAVVPDAPLVRAVLRPGMQTLPNVSREFQKLVSVDEEQEAS
jgi:hypothetical protein